MEAHRSTTPQDSFERALSSESSVRPNVHRGAGPSGPSSTLAA
jgi:hypothetical protein